MNTMEQKKTMRSRVATAAAGVAMVAALGLGSASAASATPVSSPVSSSTSVSQASFAAGPINIHTAKKTKKYQWWNPTCWNPTGGAGGWKAPKYCTYYE